jgi:hypothetical protein
VVALFEQAGDDFVRGIVGVGDEVEGFCDGDDAEEGEHFVEQGAPVAIGPDQPLVDADGERNGEDAVCGMNKRAHRLEGMAGDIFAS